MRLWGMQNIGDGTDILIEDKLNQRLIWVVTDQCQFAALTANCPYLQQWHFLISYQHPSMQATINKQIEFWKFKSDGEDHSDTDIKCCWQSLVEIENSSELLIFSELANEKISCSLLSCISDRFTYFNSRQRQCAGLGKGSLDYLRY